jgi:hypothetical protein
VLAAEERQQMTYWATRHEPIVYYMAHNKFPGAVKIGTTVNQTTRIERFCKNRGDHSFYILVKEPGDGSLEFKRQREFREYLITGDWFFTRGRLLDHLRALNESDFEPKLTGRPNER